MVLGSLAHTSSRSSSASSQSEGDRGYSVPLRLTTTLSILAMLVQEMSLADLEKRRHFDVPLGPTCVCTGLGVAERLIKGLVVQEF